MSKQTDNSNNFKKKIVDVIGYFKNLINSPVSTVTEAKKKRNQVLKLFLISIGLAVFIPSIIDMLFFKIFGAGTAYNIISIILKIPTIIGYIGFLFFGFLLFFASRTLSRMKDTECPNCKQQINNIDSVEYSILRTWVKEEKSVQNGKAHVHQIEKARVSISCVCQNCSHTKTFEKEFNTASYVNGDLRFHKEVGDCVAEIFGVKNK